MASNEMAASIFLPSKSLHDLSFIAGTASVAKLHFFSDRFVARAFNCIESIYELA